MGVTYRIVLQTADERRAGIVANANVILRGEHGIHREKLRPRAGRFVRGQKDAFELTQAKSLGDLTSISIAPDSCPEYNGWLLESVRVEEHVFGTMVRELEFTCNEWLGSTFEGLSSPRGVTLHVHKHDPRMRHMHGQNTAQSAYTAAVSAGSTRATARVP